jgi:hypothetical protein
VTSADHRGGRSGEFVLLGVTTRFTSQDGAELMAVDETIVVLDVMDGVADEHGDERDERDERDEQRGAVA